MKNSALLLALACILGCGPTSAPKGYVKHTLGDNRYFVEVDDTAGNSSLTFNSEGEGTKVVEEHYVLTWGRSNSLKIDNGELQINSIKYGKLKPGDRIVVKADYTVLINDKQPPVLP